MLVSMYVFIIYIYICVYRCVEVDRCSANWRTGRRVLYLVSRSSPLKEIGKLFTRGRVFYTGTYVCALTFDYKTTNLSFYKYNRHSSLLLYL